MPGMMLSQGMLKKHRVLAGHRLHRARGSASGTDPHNVTLLPPCNGREQWQRPQGVLPGWEAAKSVAGAQRCAEATGRSWAEPDHQHVLQARWLGQGGQVRHGLRAGCQGTSAS